MTATPASYAALGLSPGADRAAVDLAYRALIKRHHPDRGGDAARAASINHAYAEITRRTGPPLAAPTPTDLAAALYQRHQAHRGEARARHRRRARGRLWLLLAALFGGVAWVQREPLADMLWAVQWRYFPSVQGVLAGGDSVAAGGGAARIDLADAPLDGSIIALAEQSARRRLGEGGIGAAVEASRRCFIAFYAVPTLTRYDRCVAFDNAVLLIGGYGVADRGGFSAGAVTARQIEGARTLDRSYDSIETRLNRIRLAMMHRLQARAEAAIG